MDNQSKVTFPQLRRMLKQFNGLFYGVGIMGASDASSPLGIEGQGIIDELSTVTGGRAFTPRSQKEMMTIAEQVALELRNQYLIGFDSGKPADHEMHKIKVILTPAVVDEAGKKIHLARQGRVLRSLTHPCDCACWS